MVKLELSFLKSKVAKRIFSLFLIASLLPISILAYFSFKQVDTLITEKSMYQLRQQSKQFGLALYDRLLLADEKIRFLATVYSAQENNSFLDTQTLNPHFNTIISIRENGQIRSLHGLLNQAPAISESQKQHLYEENSVLLVQESKTGLPNLWLLIARKQSNNTDQTTIFAALLNPDFVWGLAENFDQRIGICINDFSGQHLFCSAPLIEKIINDHQSQNAPAITISADSFDQQQNYFVKSWSLFLQPKFFSKDFTIYSVANKRHVNEATQFLQDIFIAVLLLAITVIVFFCLLLIRRNMVPLESLMEGMKRISENDFNYQVEADSDDEFGELASSFNNMSSQLGHTIDVLKTMAEIDQSILSNTKLRGIIEITITRLTGAINCNSASIILIDSKTSIKENLQLFYSDPNNSGNIIQQKKMISRKELSKVFSWSVLLMDDANNLPDYLKPLVTSKVRTFLLAPVSSEGQSIAILIFGYNHPYKPAKKDSAYAREFADHFAVAFSNLSWKNKLYTQANYDTVTDLPNRHLINRKLRKAIIDASEHNKRFAVLFLDLDRFKHINDSLGHSAGDSLLKLISKRINSCLTNDCLLGRLGGDEFIILIKNIQNTQQIDSITKDIVNNFKHPFVLKSRKIHTASSIGIAVYPDHGMDQETLLKNADAAMYHAKAIGHGKPEYYTAELNAADSATLEIETQLHQALSNEEFELYYQPQVSIHSGHIVGAEALIRWNHPLKGMIPPDQFIPIAEQNGFIMAIGDWVLDMACKQNKQWQMQGLPKICMSINLTSKQFIQSNLIGLVKQALHENQLGVEYLDLEITESAAMVDVKKTLTTLNDLNSLGVSLSVDDYGTGYSSLSYLKDFPVQTLKIDQSFVRDMMQTPKNMAIVKSTIILGHHLNLKVIAEGVENADELAFLKAEGCHSYQGYLFSRPVPADQFAKLLSDQAIEVSKKLSSPSSATTVV